MTTDDGNDRKAELRERFKKILAARQVIVKDAKGQRGVAGLCACPVCGTGRLKYTIARINGHIWAACTTKDCVSWME